MQGVCDKCLWFMVQRVETPEGLEAETCMAFFPNPIPEKILTGEEPHLQVVEGQTQPLVYREKDVFK